MKLQYATSTVDNSGSLEHRRATIDLNPTIAHVLSRDLYQRPIEAMFREIVINAVDAHIEAGQSKAISIHLPTAWDETFFVRDYGNGLEHEQFMDIYLSYGASTRRDSDEPHGGLGLGTKSPLAYTSTFAVSSFVQGTENQYLVYYDEDNLPCVDHRSSETTNEPDGLKVSLTLVHSYDYNSFHEAAIKILKRIPSEKYDIVNNAAAGVSVPHITDEVFNNTRLVEGSGIYVVMGYVAYQLDISAVTDYLRAKPSTITIGNNITDAATAIEKLSSSRAVEIISSISTYPVHPSREYINITPRVVKKLCHDLSYGIEALLQAGPTSMVKRDILRFNLTNISPDEWADKKIRGRFLFYTGWSSTSSLDLQINDYRQFIHYLVRNEVSDLSIAGLESNQLTDYLGKGRLYFDFSPLISKGILSNSQRGKYLFVYDEPVAAASDFKEILTAEYTEVDLSELANEYIVTKREEQAIRYTPSTPRTVVRLMQDKSHNLLVLKTGDGQHKRSWESTKENVKSLEERNREIFWVPTRQGCVKDADALTVIRKFNSVKNSFPPWRLPIIIGLPASKGTRSIETAFKPIDELDAYVEEIITSDSYKRKQLIKVAFKFTQSYRNNDSYAAYGPMNWVMRVEHLHRKYRINVVTMPDLALYDTKPLIVKAKKYKEDIETKFPPVYSIHATHQYGGASQRTRLWAEEVAELTDNKPTGAKAKNDPYYLS